MRRRHAHNRLRSEFATREDGQSALSRISRFFFSPGGLAAARRWRSPAVNLANAGAEANIRRDDTKPYAGKPPADLSPRRAHHPSPKDWSPGRGHAAGDRSRCTRFTNAPRSSSPSPCSSPQSPDPKSYTEFPRCWAPRAGFYSRVGTVWLDMTSALPAHRSPPLRGRKNGESPLKYRRNGTADSERGALRDQHAMSSPACNAHHRRKASIEQAFLSTHLWQVAGNCSCRWHRYDPHPYLLASSSGAPEVAPLAPSLTRPVGLASCMRCARYPAGEAQRFEHSGSCAACLGLADAPPAVYSLAACPRGSPRRRIV